MKGRGCADGRKQRIYKTKEETTSPTISIESLFLTCIVDAMEKRHVITCDIPGAFMQAEMDEVVHVKLDGELAELLVKVVSPSSVMEANMKSPSESLISSGLCSFKIISLNLIINTKIRQKIVLDLPSVTPTLS